MTNHYIYLFTYFDKDILDDCWFKKERTLEFMQYDIDTFVMNIELVFNNYMMYYYEFSDINEDDIWTYFLT